MIPDTTNATAFWLYYAVGVYATIAFAIVIYNFRNATTRGKNRKLLEYATLLTAISIALIGTWRFNLTTHTATTLLSPILLLASQLLILKAVHRAYTHLTNPHHQ